MHHQSIRDCSNVLQYVSRSHVRQLQASERALAAVEPAGNVRAGGERADRRWDTISAPLPARGLLEEPTWTRHTGSRELRQSNSHQMKGYEFQTTIIQCNESQVFTVKRHLPKVHDGVRIGGYNTPSGRSSLLFYNACIIIVRWPGFHVNRYF